MRRIQTDVKLGVWSVLARKASPLNAEVGMQRRLAILITIAGVLGCGGSDGPTETNTAAGTYQLETVAGNSLPAYWAAAGQGQEVQVVAGSFTLSSSGSFTGTRESRIIGPGAPTGHGFDLYRGEFSASGTRIGMTFRSETGVVLLTTDADLQGNVLTVTLDGRVHVYRR